MMKVLAILGGAVAGTLLIAAPAFAGSISAPTGNPFAWPGTNGDPNYVDVSFSGFTGIPNVYIEQCDGTDPVTTPGWDAAEHCDLGSSPAPVSPDGSGNGTFQASDSNHHFKPFKGESPSGLFICKAPGDPDPSNPNLLPIFDNCKVRVSSNNTATTQDQAFLNITLPQGDGGPPPDTPEVPFAVLLPLGAIGIGGSYFVIRKRRAVRAAA
jgi:hypothetical protein